MKFKLYLLQSLNKRVVIGSQLSPTLKVDDQQMNDRMRESGTQSCIQICMVSTTKDIGPLIFNFQHVSVDEQQQLGTYQSHDHSMLLVQAPINLRFVINQLMLCFDVLLTALTIKKSQQIDN